MPFDFSNQKAPKFTAEEAAEEEQLANEILAENLPYRPETEEEIIRRCDLRLFVIC
jgi:hypothetical protein